MELDPTIATLLVTLVTSVGSFIWGKVRGKSKDDEANRLKRILEDAFEHELEEAIELGLSAVATRYKLEDAAWVVLERISVKKTPFAKRIVSEIVERGTAAFRRRLRERAAAKVPSELAELEDATKRMAAELELAEAKLKAAEERLRNSPNVEVVQ